jgi:RNA polymerase sigma-70 factor (ECF subfamily)
MAITTPRVLNKTVRKDGIAVDLSSDEQLLLRYRDTGDQRAFATLVRRYERELFNYLHRYLGDASQAEDVFQATFLQLHRRCHLFESGRSVRPWLFTIANHQAIDWLRRTRRHKFVSLDVQSNRDGENGTLAGGLVSSTPGPTAEVVVHEEQARTRHAVSQLPEPLRAAVVLIYFQGMKYREAAGALGVPEGTLKTRVHAAIDVLRRDFAMRKTA